MFEFNTKDFSVQNNDFASLKAMSLPQFLCLLFTNQDGLDRANIEVVSKLFNNVQPFGHEEQLKASSNLFETLS